MKEYQAKFRANHEPWSDLIESLEKFTDECLFLRRLLKENHCPGSHTKSNASYAIGTNSISRIGKQETQR